MSLEITPEPTPEEREALVCAVAALDASAAESPWWDAGVRESVEDESDEV